MLSALAVVIAATSLVVSIFQGYQSDMVGRAGNEIASRPEIRIRDGYVSMTWDENGEIADLAEYADDLDLEKETDGTRDVPSVMLANIGKGPALDLVVDWNIKDNSDNFGRLSGAEVRCGENAYRDGSIDVAMLVDNVPVSNYSVRQSDQISFIQEDEERYMSLLSVYLDLVARYCYTSMPAVEGGVDFSRDFRNTEMPTIKITILYRNILDNQSNSEFLIEFRPIIYDKMADGSGMCMFSLTSFSE